MPSTAATYQVCATCSALHRVMCKTQHATPSHDVPCCTCQCLWLTGTGYASSYPTALAGMHAGRPASQQLPPQVKFLHDVLRMLRELARLRQTLTLAAPTNIMLVRPTYVSDGALLMATAAGQIFEPRPHG